LIAPAATAAAVNPRISISDILWHERSGDFHSHKRNKQLDACAHSAIFAA
jgi:hypothetical protein